MNYFLRGEPGSGSTGSIALTGDVQADADIMAFIKARQNIQNIGKDNGEVKLIGIANP